MGQIGSVQQLHLDQVQSATFNISSDAGLTFTSESSAFLSDVDGDGVLNASDNCLEHFNPDQRDTDSDTFGNRCDPDLNNDSTVNFSDLQILRDFLFGPPGPTGL